MSNYKRNKERAIFNNTQPTKTDQSQARETDINVIIKRYMVTGTAPGAPQEPNYEDRSQLPTTLAEMYEQARRMGALHQQLPPQLQGIPTNELLNLTTEQINKILAPPAPTPEPPKPQEQSIK